MPECFFAHLGGCEGRPVKAHLVPKSRLRKELRSGVTPLYEVAFVSDPNVRVISEDEIIWDPRCWRWMCGGCGYGNAGHHGQYDAKQIRLDEWPADFLEYLDEYGISWIAEAYARAV